MANPMTAMPIPTVRQRLLLAMIHNGINENYTQLESELTMQGYHFTSDTDTGSTLPNFIEDIQQTTTADSKRPFASLWVASRARRVLR